MSCNARSVVEPVTTDEFTQFVKRHRYVVVMATASWCGPCRRIKPLFVSKMNELPMNVALVIVDIDKAPRLKNHLRVKSVPYIMNMINGEAMDVINTSNSSTIISFFSKTLIRVKA